MTPPTEAPARRMWPLYAAGFTTAFGAHGIAANLGGDTEDAVTSLLVLGVLLAAALIGAGTGLITPLGFAALASATPPERLGQTMGAAELGRELGDAGGPLLVAGVAAAATPAYGYGTLALLLACGPVVAVLVGARRRVGAGRA
ncbi:hypothetical protein [Streptomyces sp. NPDC001652]|uniref:hypothetical protein n=1 Tax=Streptomyces sp. NPDC001652 TaxID=3154393 RepID=UPI00332662F6